MGTIDLLGGFLSVRGGNAINPICVLDRTGSSLALDEPSRIGFWYPNWLSPKNDIALDGFNTDKTPKRAEN